ncbi:MAG: HlyC/CorC family transporter [Gammaproteobacteria bacterium]
MSVNRYRLRHRARNGHRGAQLADKLLQRPDRLIGLILIGNNLVNIFAAQLVGFMALRLGGAWWLAASGVLFTLVVLIFAEVTPKTLAALHPERVALPAAYIYYPLQKIAWPFVWFINLIANALLRLGGVRPEDASDDHLTIEELRTLVTEAGALLPRRRHQMLLRILELQDVTVDDVMVPHNEILGIDLDDGHESALALIRDSRYTRLPVYRDSIDNVSGVLHLRRLIQTTSLEELSPGKLLSLLEEPYFVPESTSLNRQLMQFQRNRRRIAFVVDEYGDIQGIVTLEDILEEIVGEFTEAEEPDTQAILREEADGFVVNASANVRSLNRTMNWHLPTDGPKTLNGLILEQLEAIPENGIGLMLDDYPIEILQTGDNVVKTVRIRPPTPSAPPANIAAG